MPSGGLFLSSLTLLYIMVGTRFGLRQRRFTAWPAKPSSGRNALKLRQAWSQTDTAGVRLSLSPAPSNLLTWVSQKPAVGAWGFLIHSKYLDVRETGLNSALPPKTELLSFHRSSRNSAFRRRPAYPEEFSVSRFWTLKVAFRQAVACLFRLLGLASYG